MDQDKYHQVIDNLGKLLLIIRDRTKLSQEKIAEKIGISVKHLRDIQNGKTNISLQIFLSIIDAFQIKITDLIPDKPEKSNHFLLNELKALLENESDETIRKMIRIAEVLKENRK